MFSCVIYSKLYSLSFSASLDLDSSAINLFKFSTSSCNDRDYFLFCSLSAANSSFCFCRHIIKWLCTTISLLYSYTSSLSELRPSFSETNYSLKHYCFSMICSFLGSSRCFLSLFWPLGIEFLEGVFVLLGETGILVALI